MNATVPFVSIIVTAYCPEAKPYLDVLIKSIFWLEYEPTRFEVIIVSPARYSPIYEGCTTVSPKEPYYNGHALNFGARHSSPKTDYFLFLNDDVILTTNSLKNLVYASAAINDRALLMPLSNDQQGKYAAATPGGSGPYKIEQIKDPQALMMSESPFRDLGIFFYETLCLYACLVPVKLWRDVGPYDESMEGQIDIDYCLRVRNSGYLNGIVLDSLMYHAGGVSANLTHTTESRQESLQAFEKKWGFKPKWSNL